MKSELIHSLTGDFESFAHKTPEGVEFWLARDLQHLLGYAKWENFQNVLSKAKTACEVSSHQIENHFPDVRKMVKIGIRWHSPVSNVITSTDFLSQAG